MRTVYRSSLDQAGDLLVFTIEATAFLRHMARNIVGTLVEVGRGQRPPDSFAELLEARDQNQSRSDGATPWIVLDGSEVLGDLPTRFGSTNWPRTVSVLFGVAAARRLWYQSFSPVAWPPPIVSKCYNPKILVVFDKDDRIRKPLNKHPPSFNGC